MTAHEIVDQLLEEAAAESGASGVTSSPASRTSSPQMQGDALRSVPATESRMVSRITERGIKAKLGLAFSRLIEADPDEIVNPKSQLLDVKKYRVKYLVFPTGNRPYGGGGWSRQARHRPAPEVVERVTSDVIFKGASVYIDGVRRLKCNVKDLLTGEILRNNYPDLPME